MDELTDELESAVILDTVFSGAGTGASPYLITSEKDLVMLQLLSNGVGNTTIQEMYGHGNFYFELTSNITLTTEWTPIAGTAENYFAGTFNGGSHTISGLAVEETAEAGTSAYAALFGYIDGAEIKNITVNGSVTLSVSAGESTDSTTQAYAGGVVAYALDSTVDNCTANVTVTASNADSGTVDLVAGGVVGYIGASSSTASASVSNSAAAAGTQVSVTTSASGDGIATVAGGVVGLAQGADITDNSSAAAVTVSGSGTTYGFATFTSTSTDDYGNNKTVTHDLNGYYYSNTAGGVAGAAVGLYDMGDTMTSGGGGNGSASGYAEVSKTATVTGNTSTATVTNATATGTTLSFAGGVVGTALFATVSGGEFGGTVNGTYAGGIVGMAAGDDAISGASLVDNAAVTGTTAAGGIAAQLGGHTGSNNSGSTHTDSTIENCTTGSATISATDYAGGIAGYVTYADAISDSSNSATVTGSSSGGIVGTIYANCNLTAVSNSGTVTGTSYAGGIAGDLYNYTSSTTGAGGPPSSTRYSTTVKSSTNTGKVIGSGSLGGIAGRMNSIYDVVDDCSNSGTLQPSGGAAYFGGVVGYLIGTVQNSFNSGRLYGSSASYIGGVVGYSYAYTSSSTDITNAQILNSYNAGTISTSGTTVGGIAGYLYGTMANCYNVGTLPTSASTLCAIAGTIYSSSSIEKCYALTGTADSLGISDGSFFDTEMKLTADDAEYETLLEALNSYVEASGTELLSWEIPSEGDYVYPVHSGSSIGIPAASNIPIILVDGAVATSATVSIGDSLTLTASSAYAVSYQWYKASDSYGSDISAIDGAVSAEYIINAEQIGQIYFFVGIKTTAEDVDAEEILSDAFALTVQLQMNEDGSISDGEITIALLVSGSENSEENPYIIDTVDKLKLLRDTVNAYVSYEGYYFRQTEDLDLNSEAWVPIGYNKNSTSIPTYANGYNAFMGVYDGNGKTISNLYINEEELGTGYTTLGLFGTVDAGTVKALTVTGSITYTSTTASGNKAYICVGGIVGIVCGGASIEDCTVENMALKVQTSYGDTSNAFLPRVGGIAGYASDSAKITGCTVKSGSTITGSSNGYATSSTVSSTIASGIGGILGYSDACEVSGCTNAAAVTGHIVGGLVGYGGSSSSALLTLTDSQNSGSIVCASESYGVAGGLVGLAHYVSGEITDCKNSGDVRGASGSYSYTGGLVGRVYSAPITGCENIGDVYAAGEEETSYTGGLAGCTAMASTISGSANKGDVVGGYYTGGLLGYQYGAISGCYNTGEVSGSGYVGGLSGYTAYQNIYNSYNTGSVSGGQYTGGLAGYTSRYIYNSYNTGTVTGDGVAGGLVGYLPAQTTVSVRNCYSAADSMTGTTCGGLIGKKAGTGGTVYNCYYLSSAAVDAIGSSTSTLNTSYLGCFDESEAVTALDGYSLQYDGNLVAQLNGWAVDNVSSTTYPNVIGWTEQENGYPTFNEDLDLESDAPAALTVTMSTENAEKSSIGDSIILSAEVERADSGMVGTVTYQWLYDDSEVSAGDISSELQSGTSTTVSLTTVTSDAGSHTYKLIVKNTATYSYSSANASTSIFVSKAADDTSWYGGVADGITSGTGTRDDPYIISDSDELAYVAQEVNAASEDFQGKYYKLTADLNLNGYTWTPIGTSDAPFTGSFDGNGHTISGLYTTTASYQGLFGYAEDITIENLVVEGEVNAISYGAGFIGYADGSLTLANCGNNASVTATDYYVGGLIGGVSSESYVSMSSCYNAGSVTGNGWVYAIGVGGLVGDLNSSADITDCYNIGTVCGGGYAGGIVGVANISVSGTKITMTNCYNVGSVQGADVRAAECGALMVIYRSAGSVSAQNCYYLSTACSDDDTGSTAITEADFADLAAWLNNGGSTWRSIAYGTVTFNAEHAAITANGSTVENGTLAMATYPALSWETDLERETADLTFTLTADTDYAVYSVTAGDETLTANDDGSYTVTVDGDMTISIKVKRVSWSGENDAANDIESIIASDAAGTESEDSEENSYDSSLDLNDDGRIDLLDILDILYTTDTKSDDTSSEVSDSEATTAEESGTEETTEASEESSAEADAEEA
ncbi:MAG: hypothetical protein LUE97_06820 [Oscillospiraceae bacterium]|nr:hypothetical protein [Oscillospiraceae bacterium]